MAKWTVVVLGLLMTGGVVLAGECGGGGCGSAENAPGCSGCQCPFGQALYRECRVDACPPCTVSSVQGAERREVLEDIESLES